MVYQKHVQKNTVGFEELKTHVQQYTPEWAYGITTLDLFIQLSTSLKYFIRYLSKYERIK